MCNFNHSQQTIAPVRTLARDLKNCRLNLTGARRQHPNLPHATDQRPSIKRVNCDENAVPLIEFHIDADVKLKNSGLAPPPPVKKEKKNLKMSQLSNIKSDRVEVAIEY